MSVPPQLKQIMEGRATLSRPDARALMHEVLAGALTDLQLGALLGGIAARGETPSELAGFIDGMRDAAVPVPLEDDERGRLVDTCGTGGDASGTFNISTAAALVAAAAGATVAKHGNRAVTSACGSADVLEALGIPVNLTPTEAAAALRTHRFAFLHAPALHPAMKAVMPVRRALGIRTVFNVLGPLANPAGARAQVMGVYSAHLVPVVAEAMQLLGVRHAFVVHGTASGAPCQTVLPSDMGLLLSPNTPGIDEISLSGPTQIAEVTPSGLTFHQLTPEEAGLQSAPLEALSGGDPTLNAQILRAIFAGQPGPPRDVVLLNAAAVLVTAGLVTNPNASLIDRIRQAIDQAAKTIDSGAVTTLIAKLSAAT